MYDKKEAQNVKKQQKFQNCIFYTFKKRRVADRVN